MKIFAFALLAVGTAWANQVPFKPYSATVHVVNAMGQSGLLGGCSSGLTSAIQDKPQMSELPHLQTDRLQLNMSHIFQAIEGYCWWNVSNATAEAGCGHGNGTYPSPEVNSCPWVGWKRGVVVPNSSSIGFEVDWMVEGPYAVAQTSWSLGEEKHHRFCFCDEATSMQACKRMCTTAPPTMPPAPSPDPRPAAHYTDPTGNGGCRMDEKAMTVAGNGTQGAICAPQCVQAGLLRKWTCPSDQPAASNARASCNLIDNDTNLKYCALICDTDADCDTGAVCHMESFPGTGDIPPETIGFCGYPMH